MTRPPLPQDAACAITCVELIGAGHAPMQVIAGVFVFNVETWTRYPHVPETRP